MSNEKTESNPKTEIPVETTKLEPNQNLIKSEAENPDMDLTNMQIQILDMETKAKQLIAEAKKKRELLKKSRNELLSKKIKEEYLKEYRLSLFQQNKAFDKNSDYIKDYPNSNWISQLLAINEMEKNLPLDSKDKIKSELTQYMNNFEFSTLHDLILTLIQTDITTNEEASKNVVKKSEEILFHLQNELKILIQNMSESEFNRCMKILLISGIWHYTGILNGCKYLSFQQFLTNLPKSKRNEIKEEIEKEFKDFIDNEKKENP